ncbi:MAG: hypothetical protein IM445_07280 [Microcystis sp. M015S1]|jgi:hypothetical protein|uniref:hypothetical protein n=1 Tax=Microcystis sp. M017S1 TaxID=2771107 RepID=UPI00258D41BD|nr:hypothetical protein [Microcystis sp. M017S1]MCA2919883.1 hypothetical protein [Microcystis sp. M017S1]MCA2934585.1 hypothetical protein [Microcystis sp. M015S1]MCA3161138.1 hypothetical protein [Burkholderiales bacterium]MCA3173717.1 hypothetical protein [Burkholderiales bacterium]
MKPIADDADGFTQTVHELKLLLGQLDGQNQPFLWFQQFGYHGYGISVHTSHLHHLAALNGYLAPDAPAFDNGAIERWKLVNDLLLEGLQPQPDGASRILTSARMLACLTAFPTLEEVARNIASRWDEEGLVLRPVTISDGVSTWKPDGSREPKTYKAGQRIVVLAHKLQLMHRALDPRLANILATLDTAFQKPLVSGLDQPMSPLYERLQYYRDHWLHGRSFEGWEALFVSFLLALIYFGSKVARVDPIDEGVA